MNGLMVARIAVITGTALVINDDTENLMSGCPRAVVEICD